MHRSQIEPLFRYRWLRAKQGYTHRAAYVSVLMWFCPDSEDFHRRLQRWAVYNRERVRTHRRQIGGKEFDITTKHVTDTSWRWTATVVGEDEEYASGIEESRDDVERAVTSIGWQLYGMIVQEHKAQEAESEGVDV